MNPDQSYPHMKTNGTIQYIRLGILAVLLFSAHSHATENILDEQPIKAVVNAFTQAMNAKDAAAFAKVFHEDADFTNVKGMSSHGRKAIEDFHRRLFEGDGTQGFPSFKNAVFKVVETRIRFVRPDVANVDVTWTQTGSVLDGRDRGLRRGLMSWLVTKESSGWGVLVMHNMDLPMEAPTK